MAFLQGETPREPFLRAPISVLLLIGMLVSAHIIRMVVPAAMSDEVLTQYAFVPARYAAGGDAGGLFSLAIPFVSHIFLHADVTHLAVNCLWLLAFGPVVARRFGAGLFLLLFAICGIAGAATFLAFNWGLPAGVIGASGAISGIMAAGLRLFPWPGSTAQRPLTPLLSSPILLFSAVWFATNFIFGLTGFGAGGGILQIAWQAHVGGFVTGLLLSGVFDTMAHPSLES